MNEFKDIIVDVDGTLANIKARVAKAEENPPPGKRMDWDIFLDPQVMEQLDRPNHHVIHLVQALQMSNHNIIITSARNERHREVTERQLNAWGIDYKKLYLRADGDFRPGRRMGSTHCHRRPTAGRRQMERDGIALLASRGD
jgi:hypothetical protein